MLAVATHRGLDEKEFLYEKNIVFATDATEPALLPDAERLKPETNTPDPITPPHTEAENKSKQSISSEM